MVFVNQSSQKLAIPSQGFRIFPKGRTAEGSEDLLCAVPP